ncbi:Uncharacterised protein [Vibrio cholerae]|nr:Uncharacterised protein [Vibrio cholerae]CSI58327.1 Uncharacterised protein [Vibrio cholerae]
MRANESRQTPVGPVSLREMCLAEPFAVNSRWLHIPSAHSRLILGYHRHVHIGRIRSRVAVFLALRVVQWPIHLKTAYRLRHVQNVLDGVLWLQ